MQIVITLPDAYAEIMPNVQNGSIASKIILDAVKGGIVLPKDHGKLIDAKEAEEVMLDVMCGIGYQSDACHVVSSEFYSTTVDDPDLMQKFKKKKRNDL